MYSISGISLFLIFKNTCFYMKWLQEFETEIIYMPENMLGIHWTYEAMNERQGWYYIETDKKF